MSPADVEVIVRERAEYYDLNADHMVRIAKCEAGPELDVRAVGAAGELGLFQLHPKGLLQDFYNQGYTDPFSPWQSADYASWRISLGWGYHWSCWRKYQGD